MGLITEWVELKMVWNNKERYESLGYKVQKNGMFLIKTIDLAPCSPLKVKIFCDGCNKKSETNYQTYFRNKKSDGRNYCIKCSTILFGIEKMRLSKLKDGISLKQWWQNNKKGNLKDILSEKSYLLSDNHSHKSHKALTWKCESNKHEDYERSIKASLLADFRCSKCVKDLKISILQEKIEKYLNQLRLKYVKERECSIICPNINAKDKRNFMPYDLEIISDSLKLIIEIQGKQHYQSSGFHAQTAKKNNSSPEEELEYQKKKDEIKKKFALSNGYNYLVIPYTSDNKNEDYKILINKSISKVKRRNLNDK